MRLIKINLDIEGTEFLLEGITHWNLFVVQSGNKYLIATADTHKQIVDMFNRIMDDYIAGITKIEILSSIKERTIIDEYRKITEDIAVVKSRIKSINREKSKLIYTYSPKDVGAIDYTKPAVQTSNVPISVTDAYIQIHDLETEGQLIESELKSLNEQRDELEKVINDLGDNEKRCMMLRIKGYPNYRIAKELNYSVRGIEEIFKRIRKKEKVCGENVV